MHRSDNKIYLNEKKKKIEMNSDQEFKTYWDKLTEIDEKRERETNREIDKSEKEIKQAQSIRYKWIESVEESRSWLTIGTKLRVHIYLQMLFL